MQEPSDGIAEEVERQLQLALAAAAAVARRAIAARQHAIEQAQRDSAQHAQALNAQIDAERQLAARLQPAFAPDRDHGYDLTDWLAEHRHLPLSTVSALLGRPLLAEAS